MSETNAEKIVFKRPDSLLPVITNYCPGCPHGIVNRLVAETMDELGIEGKTVGVCPVGCSVMAYKFFGCDMIEAVDTKVLFISAVSRFVIVPAKCGILIPFSLFSNAPARTPPL